MMRKIFSMLMIFVIVFSFTTVGNCQSNSEMYENNLTAGKLTYDEFVISEWNEKTETAVDSKGNNVNIATYTGKLSNSNGSSDLFFHNNGNAIETDIFKDSKNEGNYLVAVYVSEERGVQYLSRYFTNEPGENKDALISRVTKAQITKEATIKEINATRAVPTGTSYIRFGDYEYKESGYTMANLTNAMTFIKRAETDVEGTAGSLWDVISSVQLEKVHAGGLYELTTRLSVDQANQRLVTWGPKSTQNTGSVTFSLGADGPSASYTFDLIGGKLVDDGSTMPGNYGRWRCYTPALASPPSSYEFDVGVRATNTSGAFVLEYSHVTDISALGIRTEYLTGVVQEWVTDR